MKTDLRDIARPVFITLAAQLGHKYLSIPAEHSAFVEATAGSLFDGIASEIEGWQQQSTERAAKHKTVEALHAIVEDAKAAALTLEHVDRLLELRDDARELPDPTRARVVAAIDAALEHISAAVVMGLGPKSPWDKARRGARLVDVDAVSGDELAAADFEVHDSAFDQLRTGADAAFAEAFAEDDIVTTDAVVVEYPGVYSLTFIADGPCLVRALRLVDAQDGDVGALTLKSVTVNNATLLDNPGNHPGSCRILLGTGIHLQALDSIRVEVACDVPVEGLALKVALRVRASRAIVKVEGIVSGGRVEFGELPESFEPVGFKVFHGEAVRAFGRPIEHGSVVGQEMELKPKARVSDLVHAKRFDFPDELTYPYIGGAGLLIKLDVPDGTYVVLYGSAPFDMRQDVADTTDEMLRAADNGPADHVIDERYDDKAPASDAAESDAPSPAGSDDEAVLPSPAAGDDADTATADAV